MKKYTRIIAMLMLVLMVAALAAGCAKDYTVKGNKESSGSGEWSMDYDYLDGQKIKVMRLGDDMCTKMTLDVVTEEGKLTVTVLGQDGTNYFMESKLQTGTYEIELSGEANKYTIRVLADEHVGSFAIKAS